LFFILGSNMAQNAKVVLPARTHPFTYE